MSAQTPHRWLLGLAAALAVGAAAQAQDKAKAPVKAAPRPAPAVAVNAAGFVQQAWPDEQFDQWVFRPNGNSATARKRLEAQLSLQLDEIDRACRLTVEQKKKLDLAGRGDMKRIFDTYEAAKRKFNALGNDVQRIQEVMPDVAPVQKAMQAGLSNTDSLLHKSLRHTLTAEQLARYEAVVAERRAFRHRTNIERAVAMLEQGAPMRDAQRKEFIAVLMKEAKPPRTSGQYDFYLVMFQIGKLEAKLKPLLTETQWQFVSRQVNQYRGIEPTLRQQGLLDDDDEPEPQPAPPKR